MKTGCNPMQVKLSLFLKWGVKFEEAYSAPEMAAREVRYADKIEVEQGIIKKYTPKNDKSIHQEHIPAIIHSYDNDRADVKSKAGTIKTN